MLNHAYSFTNMVHSECYWGNALSYRTGENVGCSAFCSGDPTEICGGANSILLYQDSAWVLLSDSQYAAALEEFRDLLSELQAAVAKWHASLKVYYAAIQAAARKTRKRDESTLAQQGTLANLDQQAVFKLVKGKDISELHLDMAHS